MRNHYTGLLVIALILTCNLVFGAGSFLETVSGAEKVGAAFEPRTSSSDRLTADARERLQNWKQQQTYHTDTASLMNSVHLAVAKPVGWFDVVPMPPKPSTLASASLVLLAEYIRIFFGITLTSTDATQKLNPATMLANWTQQQALKFYELLYSLPKFFVQATKKLARVPSYKGIVNVLGYVYSCFPTVVQICNSAVRTVAQFQQTIVHEMTHCFQFTNRAVMSQWASTFWKNNKPVKSSPTSYGNTNAYEDFAESVRLYVAYGKTLKNLDPARYDFIRKYVMTGKDFF